VHGGLAAMIPLMDVEAAIRQSLRDFDPAVEQDVSGGIPETATAIEDFCARLLGSPASNCLFYSSHVGISAGLELQDGRRLVVKVHQSWIADRPHLEAVAQVQRRLVDAGFPCPSPLLGPLPFGAGLATIEELLDTGLWRDAHEPEIRMALAQTLYRLTAQAGARLLACDPDSPPPIVASIRAPTTDATTLTPPPGVRPGSTSGRPRRSQSFKRRTGHWL
jgi:hypothetical protein